ncbi:ribose 5-phosphate isomerase B [Spiroplasma endosymbiont of Aspidapion aeneum]|uniref:ribose 5-phosphate isomerase B n=1 Tax=Spiroplasma endosymbiont of Aspidapion aeneum TaxID=3066276 RepID=UPI00313C3F8E
MKIAIANDHTGVELKNTILNHLKTIGYEVYNLGTDSIESVDYPSYGKLVANKIISKEYDLGILICGTGVGITIAANKVKGIRAVVCSEPYSAIMARKHNNAQIVGIGARVVGPELAIMIVCKFIESKYEGGRHQKRVDMIE